jgi:hypothetical protein
MLLQTRLCHGSLGIGGTCSNSAKSTVPSPSRSSSFIALSMWLAWKSGAFSIIATELYYRAIELQSYSTSILSLYDTIWPRMAPYAPALPSPAGDGLAEVLEEVAELVPVEGACTRAAEPLRLNPFSCTWRIPMGTGNDAAECRRRHHVRVPLSSMSTASKATARSCTACCYNHAASKKSLPLQHCRKLCPLSRGRSLRLLPQATCLLQGSAECRRSETRGFCQSCIF